MKVKILDREYDSSEVPIMLVLSPEDKENIRKMLPECTKFVLFPVDMKD